MGNQVKGSTKHGEFQFIKCNRLEASDTKTKKVGKVEKIFGSMDLEGDKENIIEISSILHKESIAKCER